MNEPMNFPDIGLDPLANRDKVEGGVDGARTRLSRATAVRQKEVPDQTMLAWRIDVDRILCELTVMSSRWKILRASIEANDPKETLKRLAGVAGAMIDFNVEDQIPICLCCSNELDERGEGHSSDCLVPKFINACTDDELSL